MPSRLEALSQRVKDALGDAAVGVTEALGEITVEVRPEGLRAAARILRDADALRFEQLTDLCGVDYSGYGEGVGERPAGSGQGRFAVVYHLLSVSLNQRLRLRVFAADEAFPVLDSVVELWPSANWYEREAFDLFGIVFEGHPDLRRILTDYGFIGNPFRKDFPLSGNVEMRYDPDQGRVIYQPVTIEPRMNVPRIVREEHYGDTE